MKKLLWMMALWLVVQGSLQAETKYRMLVFAPGSVVTTGMPVAGLEFPVFECNVTLPPTAISPAAVLVNAGPISKLGWKLLAVDSEETGSNKAVAAFDNDPMTFWSSEWVTNRPPLPHTIQLDLGASYPINGFRYLPRQDGSNVGRIRSYDFATSVDGIGWVSAASNVFADGGAVSEVKFAPVTGRYVKLTATTEMNGTPYTSVAELDVLSAGTPAPSYFDLLPGATSTKVVWDDPLHPGMVCTSAVIAGDLANATNQLAPGRYPLALQKFESSPISEMSGQLMIKPGQGACLPPTGKAATLALTVSTVYPYTVAKGKRSRVDFTVSNTFDPTVLAVRIDGKEVSRLLGPNLRDVGSLWFTAPAVTGRHLLTLYARDATGCEYQATSIRAITVQ